MTRDDLYLARCRKVAGGDPPRALVLLWLHLLEQGNLERGLHRQNCEAQAEEALRALQEGRDLPATHPAATLRAVDRYLALLDAGHEPRVRRLAVDAANTFFVVPRRPGWTSRLAATQPGHREFWMRNYQVVPAGHRGIAIELQPSPLRLSRPPDDACLSFAAGGFEDEVFPGWSAASPYSCHHLEDPEVRWRSVESLLTEAARRGISVVVLPELTVDRRVRDLLAGWLRENRSAFALVVAGSFHEDASGAAEGAGPRHNVARVFDSYGDEVLRQVKLRPMRAMPADQVADEEIEGGTSVRILHAWFGLVAVAICLDFCEIGDSPVTDLWRTVGPALVLVPSMGMDPTNDAHREKARPLALQHGTAVVVASQHPLESQALGLSWDGGSAPGHGRPVLHGKLHWTKR